MAYLEMIDIVKRYPGVLANDHIDLAVERGEIHALMGENGAGKSTLMSILYGLQTPDEGYLRYKGSTLLLQSPLDAIANGIGMVHQAFKLFESLSVWENIVYRREPRRGPFVDGARARAEVEELARRHGLPIDPRARVATLPVGVRQRLEILKALYRDAEVLILDEPTAVLTPAEVATLFTVMRSLAAGGCTLLLVTHKLNEVMAVSDRITVLRDGRVSERLVTAHTSPEVIVRAMTGRNRVAAHLPKRIVPPSGISLEAQGLVVEQHGRRVVDEVSLQVRGGEIVGIAGVAGNGQSELIEALMGLTPVAAGTVRVGGLDLTHASVAAHRAGGLSYIAEDRASTASAATASAQDNLAMGFHRRPPLARHGLLQPKAMRAWARRLIDRFDIKIASEDTKVGTLSGGNLQKIVTARELAHDAPVLIAEQPTRGVDVGAIAFIHGELLRERERGHGILLVSAELSEILALADRILVMYAGRIVAEFARDAADEATLGLYMAGGTRT